MKQIQSFFKGLTSLAFFCVLMSCGGQENTSPESQVRAVLIQMEDAIEQRDSSGIFIHVSDNYQDHKGNNKAALTKFARGYLLANQNIGLITSVKSLSVLDDSTVAIEATILMGGRSNNTLSSLSADTQQISAVFQREDDDWKLSSMSWDNQRQY